MATPGIDINIIKEIPGYKFILKTVIQSLIQQLVDQLASTTDEECVILTASLTDGSLSHLGSECGKSFIEDHEDIKSQFLGFCLNKHIREKQQKNIQQKAETLQRNIQDSPVYSSVRSPSSCSLQTSSDKNNGVRFEPYPITRSRRSSINLDPVRDSGQSHEQLGEQIIKIEPNDVYEESNQKFIDKPGHSSVLQSHIPSIISDVKTETPFSPSIPSDVTTEPFYNPSTQSDVRTQASQYVITEADGKVIEVINDNTQQSTETNINSEIDINNNETYPCLSVKLKAIADTLKTLAENDSELECKDVEHMETVHTTDSEITGVEFPKVMKPIPDVPIVVLEMKSEPLSDDAYNQRDMSENDSLTPIDNSKQSFQSNTGLLTDACILTETRTVTCNTCGKDFDNSNVSTKPSGNHTSVKQFQCETCSSANSVDEQFCRPSTRASQLAMHSGIKLFKCVICAKYFKQKSQLTTHLARHLKVKQFECDICGESFTQKHELTRHINVHLGVKQFKCDVCGKSFYRKSSMDNHKKLCH